MPHETIFGHASEVWRQTLGLIVRDGKPVSPRGIPTLEVLHNTVKVNMSRPIVLCPLRKLSYRFMAAEALWILNGDDTVVGIAPYNPNISAFSDDGLTFFGAYGPKIVSQFDYIVRKLYEDPDTRQAVLTIWRENPRPTKDVPCTVAIAFSIREARLHCHVFMRSSDAWLGLPYDIFNFSMLALKVACAYNDIVASTAGTDSGPLELGLLHLTMASSHLYSRNHEGAIACLNDEVPLGQLLPVQPLLNGDWKYFETALRDRRDGTYAPGHWRIGL